MVHDNKVTPNFGVNQFQSKRYPDEDAVNPFEGQGGEEWKDKDLQGVCKILPDSKARKFFEL